MAWFVPAYGLAVALWLFQGDNRPVLLAVLLLVVTAFLVLFKVEHAQKRRTALRVVQRNAAERIERAAERSRARLQRQPERVRVHH
jgi:hypothetical protein